MRTRNKSIDILKVIGVFAIMLSHSRGTPYAINYFRNFEVILLVLVSGMLYRKKRKGISYLSYVKARLGRIVIPTWAFLILFLSTLFVSSLFLNIPFPYSIRDIVESFTMTNGIGYVWIMLVYCFIAIGLPLCWGFYEKCKKRNQLFLFVVGMSAIYILYELFRQYLISVSEKSLFFYVLKNTVLYFLVYSLIAWVSSYLAEKEEKQSLLFGIALLMLHFVIVFIIEHKSQTTINLSRYKYPPSIVYISYGMGVALIIIALVRKLCGSAATKSRLLIFVSKESQWVYFNHIYMIFIWNQVVEKENWVLSFLFFIVGSVLLTWLQVKVVSLLFENKNDRFSTFMMKTFC